MASYLGFILSVILTAIAVGLIACVWVFIKEIQMAIKEEDHWYD